MRIDWNGKGRSHESQAVLLALWRDGRVVWRVPKDVWALRKGKWTYQPGHYLQGHIAPWRVVALLQDVRRADAARLGRQHYGWLIPDADSTCVEIRDRFLRLSLGSSGEPPAKGREGDARWPVFLAVWRKTTQDARSLLPKGGRRVQRPDPSTWAE